MRLKKTHKKHSTRPGHAFDKALVEFRAPEYSHHEKSPLWYAVAGLVAFLLVIYGLTTGGWTFSLAIIVFAGTYYLFQRHAPKVVDVKISRAGVKIGQHIFPYGRIKYFWVVYDPPFVNKLYLRMVSKFHPDIFIQLDNIDASEVRRALAKHLDEAKGISEPFSDTLIRLFKL